MPEVTLHRLDEHWLGQLAEIARTDAEPVEVMPVAGTGPVDAAEPTGWTPDRVQAFYDFHRRRAADPARTTYVIVADRAVVGSIRLDAIDAGDVLETGLWLARSARGKRIGGRALVLVLAEAAGRGATAVIADTTVDNQPALGLLRRNGARLRTDREQVRARFET